MNQQNSPRISLLALSGLVLILLWYLLMCGAAVWYLSVPRDMQGWDGLIVAGPGMYGWIPFAILGALLGGLGWLRIRGQPGLIRGMGVASSAFFLSLASPLVGFITIYALVTLKTWLYS